MAPRLETYVIEVFEFVTTAEQEETTTTVHAVFVFP